jgi:hypothetical protein
MRLITVFLFLLLSAPLSVAGQSNQVNDTLQVSGKAVVFYVPSQKEYDLLSDDAKTELDEVLSDFYYHQENVVSYLKSNMIQDFLTHSAKIMIKLNGNKSLAFMKRDFDQEIGVIMTDGKKEPKIYSGVATDIDLINMFKEFFRIQ